MIEFAWPYLFLLIPLPWIVYTWLPKITVGKNAALRVPELNDFIGFQTPATDSSFKLKFLLLSLFWTFLLVSAARPQWMGDKVEIAKSGRDLMLAVDLSGSMQLADFEINGQLLDRLTALKYIAGDFIDRRKGDRIGLILFGSQAYLQTPLTFDVATVKQLLNESAIGLAGTETAIGDAIGLAVKQLKGSPESNRVLVLLTDGNNNAGELLPEKAADIASHIKLKIYTVAIGSNEVVIQTAFGRQRMKTEIDEKTLQKVAEITGGKYFRAYNTKELVQIYKDIDQLEKIDRTTEYYRPKDEIYFWPLLAAIILGSGITFSFWRRQ